MFKNYKNFAFRALRALFPRIVKFRREKGSTNKPVRRPNEQDDLLEKTMGWWKHDEFTKIKRFKHLRWLGFTLYKYPYYETHCDHYLNPADDLVAVLKDMIHDKIIPELNENSKVLEPGCSVGRNLLSLQEVFNCEVYGVDISAKAIKLAKEEIWKDRKNHNFYTENVLTTQFFKEFRDNYFDLIVIRNHLLNIPLSREKKDYVESLKRIGKELVVFEKMKENYNEIDIAADGRYALSWDNWSVEYELEEYHSPNTYELKAGEKVFFNKT